MQQRSPEWFAHRRGKVTASEISKIMPGRAGKYLKTREEYLVTKINETLGIEEEKTFPASVREAMAHVTKFEPVARDAYEWITGELVIEPTGDNAITDHPDVKGLCASPDGIWASDNERLIEIKCPYSTSSQPQLIALQLNEVPDTDPKWIARIREEYQWQMHCQMACTGATHVDFVQYDPRVEEGFQTFIIPFPRNEEKIEALLAETVKFLEEVHDHVDKRRKHGQGV